MRGRYVLSPRAQSDFNQIWNYTEGRWGTDQAEIYVRRLWEHIEVIAAQPTSGRACREVRAGYYKYRSGSHFLFYRIMSDGVDIICVLHERMDFERHLPWYSVSMVRIISDHLQPRPEERALARVSKDGHRQDRARGYPSRRPREERGLPRMRSEGVNAIVQYDWFHGNNPPVGFWISYPRAHGRISTSALATHANAHYGGPHYKILMRDFESCGYLTRAQTHDAEATVQRYDPLKAPDPDEWLALHEQERIALAKDYHRRKGIRLPNATLHATAHAIVENQIALGDDTPVRRTAQRLMDEGLDRHEAIHAIGMVLMEFIFDLMKARESPADPNAPYFAALERLTAEGWRRSR